MAADSSLNQLQTQRKLQVTDFTAVPAIATAAIPADVSADIPVKVPANLPADDVPPADVPTDDTTDGTTDDTTDDTYYDYPTPDPSKVTPIVTVVTVSGSLHKFEKPYCFNLKANGRGTRAKSVTVWWDGMPNLPGNVMKALRGGKGGKRTRVSSCDEVVFISGMDCFGNVVGPEMTKPKANPQRNIFRLPKSTTASVKRQHVGVAYKQQTLWGAPPPRNATSHKRPAPSADPKPPTALADAEYESVKKTFEAHTAYGAKGEGARDLQIGSIHTHTSSRAHKQALESQEKAEAEKAKQATITRWQATDASTRHVIRLLHIAHFVCKADAPIAMFVPLCWFQAKEGLPDLPPAGGYGAYYTEEALAASDAAEEVPELLMIDDVVRAFADHIGRSSVDYAKFQELQRIFCQTNLEAQGISDTRWLARGEAIQRLLDVLPTAIVVMKDYKADLYEVVTSFKFHWLIRFLADVLWELNCLNQRFQQRQVRAFVALVYVVACKHVYYLTRCHARLQVGITLVAHIVQQTRMRLKTRYSLRDPKHHFGSREKMQLPEFIQRHGAKDKREMNAEGVDGDGNPVTFEFTLHERPLLGHETDGDVTACVELSIKYVRAIDKELEWRMHDLELLEGSKLFRTASYVSDDTKRLETFKKWLGQLHKLYHHKLPGKPSAATAHVMMCVVATMSDMRLTNTHTAYCCLLD
ncbi:unnamed protein product [Closterium sp. Naga37s-1]|nr:unnamed protein product [Closterium sp. Naga37s-1]